MIARSEEVLDFWFGPLNEQGLAQPERQMRWFKKDPAFDKLLCDQFLDLHRQLCQETPQGQAHAWESSPQGALAYVIVLDQMSRNMFRDTAKMFEQDPLALAATHRALQSGAVDDLALAHQVFMLMPLMHSEDLKDQQRCVQEFARLHEGASGPAKEALAGNLRFAQAHLDIVRDYGRFPHRNATLGRTSTAEETAFLKQPGSSF